MALVKHSAILIFIQLVPLFGENKSLYRAAMQNMLDAG